MGAVANLVKKNFHRDSVQLLHLSEDAKKLEGVKDAAVVMGTPTNKEILTKLRLLTDEGKAATDNDMIIAVTVESPSQIAISLQNIEKLILKPSTSKGQRYYSLDSALQAIPDANLAIVSVPGEYAREIVLNALDRGLNVHLFSDHVPRDDEVEIKRHAKERGLLVMGPGAGTALIAGKAIGFANVVKKGRTGIVAAAGTGLQEVSVLLSEAGIGISSGLGTGGDDVKSTVGGLMMLQAIEALEHDSVTDTIVIISKPPDPDVRQRVLEYIADHTAKRYVTCFLGTESYALPSRVQGRATATKTLHGAFLAATGPSKGLGLTLDELISVTDQISAGLSETQRYIRGLYSGGTLAYETMIILSRLMGGVYSNAPLDSNLKLTNSYKSVKDSIVDLGGEEFTSGRAHPMIDPTLRQLRLVEEAKDPQVAVIIMDVILGYGSHPDPAGALLGAILEAQKIAKAQNRTLPILAHVCGTEQDPQPLSQQSTKLQNAEVHLFPTNATMAFAAALIARRDEISKTTLVDAWNDLLGPV